ncbi:MAG TPA: efflux transporter outer membrane subunit [Trinickia sp.]|uniref:efflux transporter outer membrane subunit n=1 Tax=Trinickia sp. TaxID=2571163 RepID=UPI002C4877D5|nr:efflux transporter outer membrane subunit [Trinickia sp.]HTI17634.1 efflux transporter outer membrane subunit [Trinickia sp.]
MDHNDKKCRVVSRFSSEFIQRNRSCRTWLASGCAVVLAACAVGPDFEQPAPPVAHALTVAPLPQQTQATPVTGGEAQQFRSDAVLESRWWTAYGSRELDGLVEEALGNSPTIASAQAALRAAQQQVIAQRGALFPSLDGTAGVSRQKISGASQGFPQFGTFLFTLFNASVNLSYNFDVFGGVRRGIEAQEAARDFQREELEATCQTLAANVVTTALLEASLHAQIDATNDLIESARRQVELTQKQFELGGAARADVLQAESNLASLQATLPPLNQQQAMARSQLAVYLGKPPAEHGQSGLDLAALRLPSDIPVMLPSEVVRQRPDIRSAEAQLHQASAEIGVATANMLPQIALSASFGNSAETLGSLLSSSVFSLAGNITQPLFKGGSLNANRRAAIARYDQSLAQYRQTVLLAFKNVADSLRALDNDAKTLNAQYRAQTAAADSVRLIEQRFGLGGANNLQLLIAQQQYERSRIAYVQALAARYQDTAALFLALGGQWDLPEDKMSSPPWHQ